MKKRKFGFGIVAICLMMVMISTASNQVSAKVVKKATTSTSITASNGGAEMAGWMVFSSIENTTAVKEITVIMMHVSVTAATSGLEVTLVKKGMENTVNMVSTEATFPSSKDLVVSTVKKKNGSHSFVTLSQASYPVMLKGDSWVSDYTMGSFSTYTTVASSVAALNHTYTVSGVIEATTNDAKTA